MEDKNMFDDEMTNEMFEEVMESLALVAMTDEEIEAYALSHAEPVDEYAELEADYASNAACDLSGCCAGEICPHWETCRGGWE
jgi:hypothetical protein